MYLLEAVLCLSFLLCPFSSEWDWGHLALPLVILVWVTSEYCRTTVMYRRQATVQILHSADSLLEKSLPVLTLICPAVGSDLKYFPKWPMCEGLCSQHRAIGGGEALKKCGLEGQFLVTGVCC